MEDKAMVAKGSLLMVLRVSGITPQQHKAKVCDEFTTDVKKHVCALLNDGGGELRIEFPKDLFKHISERVFSDFIRKIEQNVSEISDCRTLSELNMTVHCPQYIMLHIEASDRLCTLNYNLCLPTNIQVINVSPAEPLTTIQDIVRRQRLPQDCITNGSHHRQFVYKSRLPIRESQTVQFKIFKSEATKRVSLADRITNKSNKLANLVSAFANHKGGHLYIGVNSNTYEVEGIVIDRTEIKKIRNRISKLLSKMTWPTPAVSQDSDIPEKGTHWDLHLEPVQDINSNIMLGTYIVVIYIAAVPGGVFMEEPESYTTAWGKLKRINFKCWKHKLLATVHSDEHESITQLVAGAHDAMQVGKEQYTKFWDHLSRLRLDGEWRSFEIFTRTAHACPEPRVRSIIAFERILAAFMRRQPQKTDSCLAQFSELTENPGHAMEKAYLNAVLGNKIHFCYEGLKEAMRLDDPVFTIKFHCLAAEMTANQKDYAMSHLDKALLVTKRIYGSPEKYSDCQQIVYTYKALNHLNSSVKSLDNKNIPEVWEIEKAQECLILARRSYFGTRRISNYNKCLCLIAESDFYRRCFEAMSGHKSQHIRSAHESASEALDIANRYMLQELSDHASTRVSYLTVQLVQFKWNGTRNEEKAILDELIGPER